MSRFQKLLKKDDLAEMDHGKPSQTALRNIEESSNNALVVFEKNPERYQELVENPKLASTNDEKVGIMGSREIFILVDRSGSMGGSDTNPQLSNADIQKYGSSWSLFGGGSKSSSSASAQQQQPQQPWTLWDSARVATESIMELSLAMDKDHKLDVMMFPPQDVNYVTTPYRFSIMETTQIADVQALFKRNRPGGSTPLAEALEYLRTAKLDALLGQGLPFTVIIMTDGTPDNTQNVREFFVNLVNKYDLAVKGREYLAAFSFVQMGDDMSATRFLEELDDSMPSKYCAPVDIIDTKKDNFLFGTGEYSAATWKGPFALLHDAIFD
jgi:hypothetical protein